VSYVTEPSDIEWEVFDKAYQQEKKPCEKVQIPTTLPEK